MSSIAVNAAVQLAALAGIIVIQIAYSIAAARLLGVDAFGQFSFVFSITQILLMGSDLGLHNTAVRRIAFDVAAGRHSSAEATFVRFFSLKLLVSLILAGCAAVISVVIPNIDGSRSALLFFATGMVFQSLNTALNIGFQARGKLYLTSINTLLTAVFNLGIGVTFMQIGRAHV